MTKSLQPATSYPAIVGHVLVNLRETKELTQVQVAEHMGMAASTWSRIENGTSALSIEQLAKVADLLKMRPSDILRTADRARDAARERHVRVEAERLAADQALTLGLAVIGGAALGGIIGAALATTRDEDAAPRRRAIRKTPRAR